MNTEPNKPRLLIIDDEPLMVGMLVRLLRRRYDVTTTTSALDGLRLAVDEAWDAVLCDVMLPGLSGPQLRHKLEAEGNDVVTKMGFMTGGAFGAEASGFLGGLRRDEWLAKPFSLAELETFVEQLVNRTSRDM